MPEFDEEFEACEWESYLDRLEHYWESLRDALRGPELSDAEWDEIDEREQREDYLDVWGELDPTAAGFKRRRQEGA